MAANTITWVKASKDYHEKKDTELVPACTAIINQLAIDPDVPVAGIPAPLTVAIYTGMITALNTDVVARQTASAITLTSDEIGKMSTLIHNTDILVNYIDNVCNQKFPGNVTQITTVFARFGLTPTGHGKGGKHTFRILSVGAGSATIETPASDAGSTTHFRWSLDQTTWTIIKSAHKSTAIITGLPMDKRVYFQYDTSEAVGRGVYPTISATGDDYHWSNSISEVIPASTTTGNSPNML